MDVTILLWFKYPCIIIIINYGFLHIPSNRSNKHYQQERLQIHSSLKMFASLRVQR